MTAEVVITNQEESTVTETPTPTPSSDGGNSGGSEDHSGGYGGGKSPKTGDDTPIGTYLMLLLAAAMLAAETERTPQKKQKTVKQNKVFDQIGTITKQVQMKAVRTQSGSPFADSL